jgi:hypothetical protein
MPYELLSGEELISGTVQLSGEDDYSISGEDADSILSGVEIVGRKRPSRGGRQQRGDWMKQAAAYKQAQSGIIVRDQPPTKARRLVLPMTSTGVVTAGTSATITARPQTIAFKPIRITIPATIGPDFTIEDIKVGNKSQLAQSGSLPAEAFVQTAFGVEMDMDTVQTSQDFVLQVTNISGANRTFRAAIFGRSADY